MTKQATAKKPTAKRATAKKSVSKTAVKKPVSPSKKTATKRHKVTIDPTYNPNGVTFLVSTAAVMILFVLALVVRM